MQRYLILFFTPLILLATSTITVFDAASLRPVPNACVIDTQGACHRTDADGTVRLADAVDEIRVKACGYRPYHARLESDSTYSVVTVEPIRVKALYLSFWGASMSGERFEEVLTLAKQTEINAVVVDVKNEYGLTSYKTSVSDAARCKAHCSRTIRNLPEFLKRLKNEGIYTIARIVVFKDPQRAAAMPEMALKRTDGTLWRNNEGLSWVDPFLEANRRYNVDIAEDAARMGFDEINFDYIRFPETPGLRFSQENRRENRVATVAAFLKSARDRLQPYGVFISVDTFGQVSWDKGDTGIGQTVASMAQYADYISPMLYPSGFSSGWMGLKDPTSDVSKVVYGSLERLGIEPVRVRPWLQAFRDYAHGKSRFGATKIRAQIDAAERYGSGGWLLWNPRSRYTHAGLRPARAPGFSVAGMPELSTPKAARSF